jgi:hypothetical protein
LSIELYDLTVPVFIRTLGIMSKFLERGRAYAAEKGIDEAEFLTARLYEDMAPLTAQIQRVSDTSKLFAVRVGAVENVPMEDNEASFADLQARLTKTIDFLKSVPADAINGKEAASVIVKFGSNEVPFTGLSYAQGFAIPNFYFHVTTAYAILRMKGVPVGKLDYLGGN